MSLLFRLSLFYLSFTPLWISVLFIDIKSIAEKNANLYTEEITIICILILAAFSLVVLLFETSANCKEGTQAHTIVSAQEEKAITAEYLLSYILPLFAFDFTHWDGIVLFLMFFLTLGFLCIRHNYFSVNIILELMNFRFYKCKLKNEDNIETEQTIISHRRLNGLVGEIINLKSLNNEYKLDIK